MENDDPGMNPDRAAVVYHPSKCGANVAGKLYQPAGDGGVSCPADVAKHLVESFGFSYEKPEAPKGKAK